ncbi:MAG: protein SCO1/2 [Psychromonas sp.]|jgi:protein SCO1/2
MNKFLILLFSGFLLNSCSFQNGSLPYLGRKTMDTNGIEQKHTIPEFDFVNQYGESLSQKDMDGHIYVADFFFTSCPTICPVMKTQLLRVYEHFDGNDVLKILSHSIDPYHDSVKVLHDYAAALGISGNQWNFVTGDQEEIYEIGENAYMVPAQEDTLTAEETGGFLHSGAFILVDKNRYPRGIYDGTVEKEVNQMIRDIELLMKEEE